MGAYTDRSVNYLKSLNLNAIVQLRENLVPLRLLGEYGGAREAGGVSFSVLGGGFAPTTFDGVLQRLEATDPFLLGEG